MQAFEAHPKLRLANSEYIQIRNKQCLVKLIWPPESNTEDFAGEIKTWKEYHQEESMSEN